MPVIKKKFADLNRKKLLT